jgi:hypothetical protein
LDLGYYRDGLTVDAGSTLLTGIARPLPDRMRLYLAGQGPCVREKSGFVAQVNYRPHNEGSFRFIDTDQVGSGPNSYGVDYGGDVAAYWFARTDVVPAQLYTDVEF